MPTGVGVPQRQRLGLANPVIVQWMKNFSLELLELVLEWVSGLVRLVFRCKLWVTRPF